LAQSPSYEGTRSLKVVSLHS